jgi:cell division protein FtsB
VATSPRLNLRALAFIATVLAIVLMLAVPLRALIKEKREIASLKRNLVAQQAAIDELNNTKTRLEDPAYLEALVRSRLNYVFPGEVGFVVLDKETSTAINTVPGALVPNNDAAWYSKLWLSTKLADQPKLKNDPLVVKSPKSTP